MNINGLHAAARKQNLNPGGVKKNELDISDTVGRGCLFFRQAGLDNRGIVLPSAENTSSSYRLTDESLIAPREMAEEGTTDGDYPLCSQLPKYLHTHDAKILIVDDQELIPESLARELSQENNYQLTCVSSGKEAKMRLRNERYDLIISNLMMSDINGIALLREIKETTPETSIIILTGYGDLSSVIDALHLAEDDYLTKPRGIDELTFRILRCLEKHSLAGELRQQNNRLKKQIADRKIFEQKLRNQAERIKLFSYSIAHDIKVPAVSLQGLAKLFIQKFGTLLPEKGHRYCTQILHSAQQIVSLSDQINTFMSAKESPLRLERIALRDVVASIWKEFAQQFDARQIKLRAPTELPLIWADRNALLRSLRNCIDNALKYGGEELHEIIIQYKQTRTFHILSVNNDGKKITRDECETIFELFRRGKSSQGIKGTGLGLAIVKEIIQRHKGEVWAEPGDKNGVTFHMSIAREL